MLPLSLPLLLLAAADLPGAREAYESGRYERCVELLRGAATKDEHLTAGLCQFVLGQPGEAARHFNQALELDAAAQLPPFSSPKVVNFFRELKEQRPAPAPDLDRAVALFERGEFEGAAGELRPVLLAPRGRAEEVRARLLEGALKWAQGAQGDGDAALRAALVLEPTARFPFQASAAAQARLEHLRAPTAPLWPRVLLPAAAGVALLATGGVLYGLARQGADELGAGDATITNLDGLTRKSDTIRSLQAASFVLGGTGLAALATAGVLWLLGRDDAPVRVVASAQGAHLVWLVAF